MNIIFKPFAVILLSLLVTGCANNVHKYRVDSTLVHQLKPYNLKMVKLQSVTMPKNDDNHGTMCRLHGMISLPNKMTYSQYIEDALQRTLISLNATKETPCATHDLKVALTEVTLTTLSGKWTIVANVTVDNHAPIKLQTIAKHDVSFLAPVACANASKSFDEAVEQFIKEMFMNPQIKSELQ